MKASERDAIRNTKDYLGTRRNLAKVPTERLAKLVKQADNPTAKQAVQDELSRR